MALLSSLSRSNYIINSFWKGKTLSVKYSAILNIRNYWRACRNMCLASGRSNVSVCVAAAAGSVAASLELPLQPSCWQQYVLVLQASETVNLSLGNPAPPSPNLKARAIPPAVLSRRVLSLQALLDQGIERLARKERARDAGHTPRRNPKSMTRLGRFSPERENAREKRRKRDAEFTSEGMDLNRGKRFICQYCFAQFPGTELQDDQERQVRGYDPSTGPDWSNGRSLVARIRHLLNSLCRSRISHWQRSYVRRVVHETSTKVVSHLCSFDERCAEVYETVRRFRNNDGLFAPQSVIQRRKYKRNNINKKKKKKKKKKINIQRRSLHYFRVSFKL
ncbi:hypothetical protein PUN28_000040 [Cardiocondyla obscurior]|uniref:Uncharacterized protein n=1 Tax=Cardiocondyla obscurior TaxID=286306 RepID=A0AAW2GXH0_9HYME